MNPADRTLINAEPGVVTVWSDLGCPWGSLALHTLRRAARARHVEVRIDHRVFPLELFNRIPTPKHIIDVEVAALAAVLPELEWSAWSAKDSEYPVTMCVPMAAVQAAKHPDVGGLRASDQLDEALRRAYYVESRCISMPGVIEDLAAECPDLDERALAMLMARGAGYAEVYRDFRLASTDAVQGSPHVFTSAGYAEHNPGADYSWTGHPPTGFPRVRGYDAGWVDRVLDAVPAGV